MNRYDTMFNTLSNILSNINLNQSNEILFKIRWLQFDNNTIAIICKLESSQEMISIFFGIKHKNTNYNTFEENVIIFKFPFVLFTPNDSIDIYKYKLFLFYYSLLSLTRYDNSIKSID